MKSYIAVVRRTEREVTLSFPDLPGLEVAGSTIEAARSDAAQALASHLKQLVASGDVIPVPSSLVEIASHPQWRAEQVDAIILAVRPVARQGRLG